MNIVEILGKKRFGEVLTRDELSYSFGGYLDEKIKDYQMSALLMAICINGMTDEEIFDLVDIFISSGEILDLSNINGIKVDKHSTGGVGDKTTLIVAPIVAASGVVVPKMSGRGLGHTGGTIDKLESIPGFNVNLTKEEFINELAEVGMAITSQTEDLTPLDKVIYSLRDTTGTVSSIPLIAVSIMSKKIASGADKILIDIKVGNGALIKDMSEAEELKDLMIRIGDKYGREVRCLINNMDNPLGFCVGNALEVIEAMQVLRGKIKNNLLDVSIDIAANMISMGRNISYEEAEKVSQELLSSGKAYDKFLEFVKYQSGDIKGVKLSNHSIEVKAKRSGTINKIDALGVGELSCRLGAGRVNKEDEIDYSVGVIFSKGVGSHIEEGEVLARLYVKEDYDGEEDLNKFVTIE